MSDERLFINRQKVPSVKNMATSVISTSDDYALFCEGKLANPYLLLSELRDREPVHWSTRLNA